MPKQSKYPKLRVSIKRGKAGQVWTSHWYDMRGTGKPDIPLGNDRAAALCAGREDQAGTVKMKGRNE